MSIVIDLSSDEEATALSTQDRGIPKATDQHCQAYVTSQNSNNEISTLKRMNKVDSDFIDHVVMIWLSRVRKGYKNLTMPDNILKAKRKEAANLLNVDDRLLSNHWLLKFKDKFEKMQYQQQVVETGSNSVFRIEEIIKEEKPKFYSERGYQSLETKLKEIEDLQQKQLSQTLEEQKKHLEKVKEAKRMLMKKKWEGELNKEMDKSEAAQNQQKADAFKQKEQGNKVSDMKTQQTVSKYIPPTAATRKYVKLKKAEEMEKNKIPKPVADNEKNVNLCEVIDVDDDVLDEPIQSYDEALDVMSLVENYLLAIKNLDAILVVNQIQSLLKFNAKS